MTTAAKGVGDDEDGTDSGSSAKLLAVSSSLARLCSDSGLNGDDTAPQDDDAPRAVLAVASRVSGNAVRSQQQRGDSASNSSLSLPSLFDGAKLSFHNPWVCAAQGRG
ncbi:uncharacterized protein DS421_20g691880 [Arachis hypogaea]|nr:uncharacterized protein DS421_20g691880 [Arachis hypogaea]